MDNCVDWESRISGNEERYAQKGTFYAEVFSEMKRYHELSWEWSEDIWMARYYEGRRDACWFFLEQCDKWGEKFR